MQNTYEPRRPEEKLAALDAGFGILADRDPSSGEYVDAIRGDVTDRLRRVTSQ
ncbi:MAG TPA: hypothetical protein VFB34_10330 [Chloroflexota bacterium]|nr:hypothetical protein [Chloroflexota bacterium]